MNNDKISNGHYEAQLKNGYLSFKLKYMPWFAGRSFVKGLKFIMFPKRICKSKAIIEAIVSE